MDKPNAQQLMEHVKSGISVDASGNLKCIVCDQTPQPQFFPTGIVGEVECPTCGVTYQSQNQQPSQTMLQEMGVDSVTPVSAFYCDMFYLYPVLSDYWEKNKRRMAWKALMGAQVEPERSGEFNDFYKWLYDNAQTYEKMYPNRFMWEQLKAQYSPKPDDAEEPKNPDEKSPAQGDTDAKEEAPALEGYKRFRLLKALPGIPAKTIFYKVDPVHYRNKSVVTGRFLTFDDDYVTNSPEWFEEIPEGKRWFPKKTEQYFMLDKEGEIAEAHYDGTVQVKEYLQRQSEYGNLFISRDVAEMARMRIKDILALIQSEDQ